MHRIDLSGVNICHNELICRFGNGMIAAIRRDDAATARKDLFFTGCCDGRACIVCISNPYSVFEGARWNHSFRNS